MTLHRSLADVFRSWDTDALTTLLKFRPDLATPPPSDFSELAARAGSRVSVYRAIETLNVPELLVLRAIHRALLARETPSVGSVEIELSHVYAAFAPEARQAVEKTLELLAHTGLLYKTDGEKLRLVTAVRDAFGTSLPAASVAEQLPGPEAFSPPRFGDAAKEDTAAQGAQSFQEFLDNLDQLLDVLSEQSVKFRHDGGIEVREARRLSRQLGLDDPTIALLLHIAHGLDLLEYSSIERSFTVNSEVAAQWFSVSTAGKFPLILWRWLISPSSSLVGGKTRNGTVLTALSQEVNQTPIPALKTAMIDALTAHPQRATNIVTLTEWLSWHRPSRRKTHRSQLPVLWKEAETIGITSQGTLTPFAYAAYTDSIAQGTAELVKASPAPVDMILIQSDLTAIAPGPLKPPVLQHLKNFAHVEGRGTATTFRFTPDSLTKAFRKGFSAAEIVDYLSQHSLGELPQPLLYTINDLARTLRPLKIGTTTSYLVEQNTDLLDSVQNHAALAPAQFQRIAPTVLVSSLPHSMLERLLDSAGFIGVGSPVPNNPAASDPIRLRSSDKSDSATPLFSRNLATERSLRETLPSLQPSETENTGQWTVIVDRLHQQADQQNDTPVVVIDHLQHAAERKTKLWLDVVDSTGRTAKRLLRVERITGGHVLGVDQFTGAEVRIPLHRIADTME